MTTAQQVKKTKKPSFMVDSDEEMIEKIEEWVKALDEWRYMTLEESYKKNTKILNSLK